MAKGKAPHAAKKLWAPSQAVIESAQVTQFARWCVHRYGLGLNTYPGFHRWSCDDNDKFWSGLWDWAGVRGRKGDRILVDGREAGSVSSADRGYAVKKSLALGYVPAALAKDGASATIEMAAGGTASGVLRERAVHDPAGKLTKG